MSVKLLSSSGGSVEIAAPVTASNYVLTAPTTSSTIDTLARTGNVLQVVNSVVNTTLSGAIGGGGTPAYNNGTSYMTINFTPTSSSSKILVQSSSLSFSESTNTCNNFWLAAFYDTTRIGVASGTGYYVSFANNLNVAHQTMNFMTPSWGTVQKTIDIRVGSDSTGEAYVNYNPIDGMNSLSRNFAVTLWEIAG